MGPSTNGDGAGLRGRPGLGSRVAPAGGSPQELWSLTRATAHEIRTEVERRVSRHPYGMVAAAMAAGYVLAGGLFTPLSARIFGAGLRVWLRMAALPLIRAELVSAIRLGGDEDGEVETRNKEGVEP